MTVLVGPDGGHGAGALFAGFGVGSEDLVADLDLGEIRDFGIDDTSLSE